MLHIVARAFKWLPLLLLVIVTGALYVPSIDTGYFADDFDFAVRYRNTESLVSTVTNNTDGSQHGGSWRPLTAVSLWITMQAESPAFDHLVSLVLYVGIVCLVYAVARELFPEQSSWFAAGVAYVFAVIPAHAEPVIWVAARADLLAALGGIGALLLWLRGYPWWSLAALVFSWLSKEVWILFGAALLFVPSPVFNSQRVRAVWAAVAGLTAAVWLIIRYAITHYGVGGYSITSEQNVFGIQHLANEFISFTLGVWSYGEFQSLLIRFSQHYWFIIVWILMGCSLVFAYQALIDKRLRLLLIGLGATGVPMLLLSIPMIRPEASVGEQRYWFAPSLFVVLICAHIISRYSYRIIASVTIIVILFGIAGTRHNIYLYKDAAVYRDRVLAQWRIDDITLSQTKIFGLPDTWHGVHLFASPFFERALILHRLAQPREVSEWYQWCTEACNIPATTTIVDNAVLFAAADPRIFSAHSRGLRYSITVPLSTTDNYAFWTGSEWTVVRPAGVEKTRP